MKKKLTAAFICLFFGFISPSFIPADEGETNLSRRLQRLLAAEMNAIQNGMTNLTIAVPAGRWEEIAETAKNIKKGYILRKKLSRKEMKEFNRSLPAGYRELDNEHQETAGRLAQAAMQRNIGLVTSYYSKLIGSCVNCHAKYAKERFQGFRQN